MNTMCQKQFVKVFLAFVGRPKARKLSFMASETVVYYNIA